MLSSGGEGITLSSGGELYWGSLVTWLPVFYTIYIIKYQMSYTDTGYQRLLHLFPAVPIGFVLGFPCYLVTCILHYIYI